MVGGCCEGLPCRAYCLRSASHVGPHGGCVGAGTVDTAWADTVEAGAEEADAGEVGGVDTG
jgi:hypothetical protein